MARAVRKVSRATTKDQKKESRINKKWLIISLSIVLAILIGLGVGLGVYFGTKKDNTYVSDKIYFAEEIVVEDSKITFNKENYQTVLRHLDRGDNAEEMFIFIYDGNAYYGDEKDEDHYKDIYTKLIKRLAELQLEVNKAKSKGVSIELYVIDVAVDSSTNSGILFDSKFGALYSNDELNYEPAFIYLKDGKYQEKVEYEADDAKQSHIISEKSIDDVYNSSIYHAMNYIRTL
ncbi:MAG: hypothetical protein K2J93_07250 [Anaeroplasmataceae bacterium]|nr:hypothetical protein [Anaeroplasmataceae bacterium]